MEISEAIGLFAGLCTTIAFLPQILKAAKTKSTKDVSGGMLAVFLVGVIAWCFYGFIIGSLPILLWNIITFVLLGSLIWMKMNYG
ncbi:SemiSWEET transporter [Candidatus Micrarchaeota archaeon]|nr:SemiSWEET transporter [Candidatus Micrarchaeota archaeon]